MKTRKQQELALEKAFAKRLHPSNPYDLSDTDLQVVAKIAAHCQFREGGMGVNSEDITLAFDYIAFGKWEADDPQAVVCAAADLFGIEHSDVCS